MKTKLSTQSTFTFFDKAFAIGFTCLALGLMLKLMGFLLM